MKWTAYVDAVIMSSVEIVAYICVSKLTIIGSDNGLSPGRRQAIIWTSAGILIIGPMVTNISEILIEIYTFSFKKPHLKISSGKWRPFCLGLNVLNNLQALWWPAYKRGGSVKGPHHRLLCRHHFTMVGRVIVDVVVYGANHPCCRSWWRYDRKLYLSSWNVSPSSAVASVNSARAGWLTPWLLRPKMKMKMMMMMVMMMIDDGYDDD